MTAVNSDMVGSGFPPCSPGWPLSEKREGERGREHLYSSVADPDPNTDLDRLGLP